MGSNFPAEVNGKQNWNQTYTRDWEKGERFQISRKDASGQGSWYLDGFHAGTSTEHVPRWKVAGLWRDVVQTLPLLLEHLCSVPRQKLQAGTALI